MPIMTIDGTQINDSMNIINEVVNLLSDQAISTSEKELYNGSDAQEMGRMATRH